MNAISLLNPDEQKDVTLNIERSRTKSAYSLILQLYVPVRDDGERLLMVDTTQDVPLTCGYGAVQCTLRSIAGSCKASSEPLKSANHLRSQW